ncbi:MULTISPECIES: hypothetical protein [Xanthomonas]|uniref:hypothetical protein n=1 Tax=Xanthomonas TaxID=338 RepID=UPI00161E5D3B|nr:MULTISPECIES: hypothetical protein [Xanthomonas]MBB6367135.1 hypothetical protein [Xanthomonas sp. F10]MCI2244673.1 hypothetical protein [Xanthomonas indica]UYC11244.1 hypothetical protein NUG21_15950 [Xanthomonas sp. CFBP 8445]
MDPLSFSLPTVIWSGIVAAFISLSGVVLSNRASMSRLKEQLRHDAKEKHQDRLASLRRDVYLPLIAETNRANGYLGTLSAQDPTEGSFGEPLQGVIAMLAKVQLVGSQEATAAAAELTALYGEVLLRLIGLAKPMHEAKIDIRISDELYQQSAAQVQRVLSEIAAENESGAPNQVRLASLFSSLSNYREQSSIHSDARNAAWDVYNSNQQGFARAVLEEIKRLGPAQISLMCAIRGESGLDADASELKKRLEENSKRGSRAIDELLSKLDSSVDG